MPEFITTDHIQEIGMEYNADMLQILRETPVITGNLAICFDRQPDIFALAHLYAEKITAAGYFHRASLVGFVMLLQRLAYVNGVPQNTMYYCNMHVIEKARNRGFFYKASNFLAQKEGNCADVGYAIVMKGNRAAERFINRKKDEYPSIPHSFIIGELDVKNILITFPLRKLSSLSVRTARPTDIDTIVKLQQQEFSDRLFAPFVDRSRFLDQLGKRPGFDISNYYVAEQKGRIVGTCCAWDAASLKQTRILHYGNKLKLLLSLYNMGGRIAKLPTLPQEHECLRSVTITEIAIPNNSSLIMEALLRKIYMDYRARGYQVIVFGSYHYDPILNAARSFFYRTVRSHIIMFTRDLSLYKKLNKKSTHPYIELILL